jgi:hypothetical protein
MLTLIHSGGRGPHGGNLHHGIYRRNLREPVGIAHGWFDVGRHSFLFSVRITLAESGHDFTIHQE